MDQIPVPEPGRGEALVRVRASALNRIDIWIRLGKPSRPKPHTLGRRRRGRRGGARAWRVTARSRAAAVVINPGLFCGTCEACLRGQQSLCEHFAVLGEHVAGTHADYCVVPVANLHPKPEPLSLRRRGLPARVRDRLAHVDDQGAPAARRMGTRVGRRVGRRQRGGHACRRARGARDRNGLDDDVLAVARERGAVATINHRERGRPGAVRELTEAAASRSSTSTSGPRRGRRRSRRCVAAGDW